jgi:hypothetical protein
MGAALAAEAARRVLILSPPPELMGALRFAFPRLEFTPTKSVAMG